MDEAIKLTPRRVKRLPDLVINQIAAGEVVDRPAAVVRELVDNAIDAGADDISINLEDGGRELIRVGDNGCGMEQEDAVLSWERHATSKISESSELDAIGTLGFRGEALSSIASVARIKMRTQRADSTGCEIIMCAGELERISSIVRQAGTEIEVRNLFFNTPARKKFLRQPATETTRVKQWLSQYSLAYPHVKFRLTADGKEIFSVSKSKSDLERMAINIKGESASFSKNIRGIHISGVVAHPALALRDSSGLIIFVNHRLVKDRLIIKAVKEGYDSMLKYAETPLAVISINIPYSEVDVNVHPQKSEVRFKTPQNVFLAIKETVLHAVKGFKVVDAGWNDRSFPNPDNTSTPLSLSYSSSSASKFSAQNISHENRFDFTTPKPVPITSSSLPATSNVIPIGTNELPFRFSDLRYIGQVMECYLLCEHQDRMFILDMHAAHERVNFNIIRDRYHERSMPTQQLLVPITVSVGLEGAGKLVSAARTFEQFGLYLEPFGEDTLIVRAAPAMLPANQIESVIKDLAVADPIENSGICQEQIDKIAARIACHASIRSGFIMTPAQAQALFEQLDRAESSGACPHGRPVVVRFRRAQVEQWFGRDR